MKELEENIAAVSFTANSKMGKALMAKCKTLQEENDEIGRQNEEGEVVHSLFRKSFLIFLFVYHVFLHLYGSFMDLFIYL